MTDNTTYFFYEIIKIYFWNGVNFKIKQENLTKRGILNV